ncbi:uncharacterized protein B0P05DRAFT_540132 [Gilbertella persicaria]|uniref:uncharacterized protein n=1 Tax=Gilbertella persicaria TaxID=101096 RepID=UPI00221E7472|nr:uncharacterized protein B0P05DRAFT_540132 [Gilbertella persicaria]KAI8080143.1 hypothetical protein B0P05DRAFT_540132 [Gilbertella persicaria]
MYQVLGILFFFLFIIPESIAFGLLNHLSLTFLLKDFLFILHLAILRLELNTSHIFCLFIKINTSILNLFVKARSYQVLLCYLHCALDFVCYN